MDGRRCAGRNGTALPLEVILFVLLPIFAAAMARGYGDMRG
jgi:uncharacterized membrane protein